LIMTTMNDGQHGLTIKELAQNELYDATVCPKIALPGITQLGLYLLVFMVISWALMFFIPTPFLFTVILPASFYVLYSLVVFSPLVSGGWPFAPPLGSWRPGQSCWKPGLATTALLAGVSLAGPLFTSHIYPRFPLFPVGFWWGIILFTVTLW
jgi:hypothetical protein